MLEEYVAGEQFSMDQSILPIGWYKVHFWLGHIGNFVPNEGDFALWPTLFSTMQYQARLFFFFFFQKWSKFILLELLIPISGPTYAFTLSLLSEVKCTVLLYF